MESVVVLDLRELESGIPALTQALGQVHAQAAAVARVSVAIWIRRALQTLGEELSRRGGFSLMQQVCQSMVEQESRGGGELKRAKPSSRTGTPLASGCLDLAWVAGFAPCRYSGGRRTADSIWRNTMSASKARYSPEEFSRRGKEIYDRDIRPVLRPEDEDQFVAIDIESGSYEIDRDDFAATERLLARHSDAQIWLARVGQRAAYRIGARSAIGGTA
jgi:hypothetical protein